MEAPEETEKKQLLPNRLTEDRELEAPTAANIGTMSIPGAAVTQRPLSPQDAQSQVKLASDHGSCNAAKQ